MNVLLDVRGVSKAFGGVVANRDISLQVAEGSIVGLIGPNGSGKTTLFNCIAGFHAVDSGSIRFDGREITRLRVPQISRLGMIRTFQQTRVFCRLTCLQNVLISASERTGSAGRLLAGFASPILRRARGLLEFAGLAAKRDVAAGSLSFGQQKLLEFAMALMAEPRLLLLDEPTAGVNPTLVNDLVARLREANARMGVSLLVIEHNMRVVDGLAHRVCCLAHGELLAEDTADAIVRDPRVIDAYLGTR